MVAKQVQGISSEASDTDQITFTINMIRPEDVPKPRLLNEADLSTHPDEFVNNTGVSGKFFDSLRPRRFSGEREDFEGWHQRFEWYTRNKPAVFATTLRDWGEIIAGHIGRCAYDRGYANKGPQSRS